MTSSLRPNPAALVPRDHSDDDDNDDSEGDDEDDESGGGSHRSTHTRHNQSGTKKNAFYKVPKMAAMPYQENEKEADKRLERMQRQRKKLNNSEIMETLREEFGSAPETTSSSGMSKINLQQRQLVEEADERRCVSPYHNSHSHSLVFIIHPCTPSHDTSPHTSSSSSSSLCDHLT